jgi:predicted MFS family arabinose efflux permease
MIAPALTAQTLLVTRLAPAKHATEAFTWSSTFIVAGLGIGMAAGGAAAEQFHAKAPFLLAGGIVAAMSLLSLRMKSTR